MASYSTVQGPNTGDVRYELGRCTENWWMNLLHLQGYLTNSRCMEHTWYVAVDAHLCLIAMVVFFCLKKYSIKFVVGLLTLVIMVSSVVSISERFNNFDKSYQTFITHTRFAPWFVGFLLGLIVYQFQSRNRTHSLRRSRAIVIASSFAMIAIYFASPTENLLGAYNVVYETAQHILFGIAVAFIIFALANEPKDQSSFTAKVLSHPNLQFISKLSYSFYLVHIPVIRLMYAINRSPMYLTKMTMFTEAIVVFCVSILAAIPFTLLFEMPIVNLFSTLFPEYN